MNNIGWKTSNWKINSRLKEKEKSFLDLYIYLFTLGNKNGHAQSILFVKSVDGNIENVTYSCK